MRSRLALIGGEEFSPGFEAVHAALLAEAERLVPRRPARVVFLPTCAADDGDEAVDYWCTTARAQLSALGAEVETPRVVDGPSANDAHHAALVAEADWIYLGGGYPHVAMRLLPGSRVLEALRAALARGVLVSGASGGAMLMGGAAPIITPEIAAAIGQVWEAPGGAPANWDPPQPKLIECLDLVPRTMCAPHYNRVFAFKWLERGLLPSGFTLVGIDEQTALLSGADSTWSVMGRGAVTLYDDRLRASRYDTGERLQLPAD